MNRERSLKMSIYDGLFCAVTNGLTSNYVTPFALAMGAKDFAIGLMSAIPSLVGALVELKTADIAEALKSRLRTIVLFVSIESGVYILLGLLPLFIRPGNQAGIVIFVLMMGLMAVCSRIESPNWTSLMSELVEKTKYGDYFGYRGSLTRTVSISSVFAAGLILTLFTKHVLAGFMLLFIAGGVFRLISCYFISRMDDVPISTKEEHKFSYWKFIRRYRVSNFVKFVVFSSAINFSVAIASPFFSVYMLRDLHMSYSLFTIVNVSAAIVGLGTMRFWGKMADRLGNARVIKFTTYFLPIVPLLWLVSQN
ncbi:MAG: hypothetical protein A2297_07480, partial [Elusimicrobia bacterium RIFOXYB2_FULL_48_7]